MCLRTQSWREGKDGIGVLEEKRFDFGSFGVGISAAHLDEGLRETPVEQQVAGEVRVGSGADIEHADERAPKALAESHPVGGEVVRSDLSDIDRRRAIPTDSTEKDA